VSDYLAFKKGPYQCKLVAKGKPFFAQHSLLQGPLWCGGRFDNLHVEGGWRGLARLFVSLLIANNFTEID
jgi:hypothetical protein